MSTFRTNSSLRRAAGVVLLGALVLGGTFATAAAFSGRGSSGGQDPDSPAPSRAPVVTPEPSAPVVTPEPAGPAAAPDPIVTPDPVVRPDPVVTPDPNDPGEDAIPLHVDLETADGHEVWIDIDDLSGMLESAESGHPGDGMSVEPYTLKIENVDERTLRLTWVDFGIDNSLGLYIDEPAKHFVVIQPDPDGEVDAMGHDRELILTFEEPISAYDIEGFVQGGLDTPGDDAA